MRLPLILLIAFCMLLACANYGFTGAATTQSFVTILAPTAPPTPGPAAPGEEAPAAIPGVPLAPAAPQMPIYYIGDFAVNNKYTVLVSLYEQWVYTYKGQNHTVRPVFINGTYAEFEITTIVQHVKLNINQTAQIDSDQNGFADVKITLNSISNNKANITVEIPPELIIVENFYRTPILYYLLIAIIIMLVIDTLIHHRKAGHIFKHIGKVQK